MCSESYLNYDKRVNLFSRKIGKDRIDFIKKDGIVTYLSEKYEYLRRCTRNTNNHTGS
jgi:hypothetical protein